MSSSSNSSSSSQSSSSSSSSSSSVYSYSSSSSTFLEVIEGLPYSYFENDETNLLNVNGVKTGPSFYFPEDVNTVYLSSYSGSGVHSLKLQRVSDSAVIADLIPGRVSSFPTVSAGEQLKVSILNGTAGDVLQSYDVKFGYNSDFEVSPPIGESYSSDSTDSSSDSSSSNSSSSESSSSNSSSSSSS